MENLPPPNDNQKAPEEEPFMCQAPVDIDGFAPHWFGEHFPNINNGWIEWDVPLGGEMDEQMVDPEVNEEVMDVDNLDVEDEWLMAPVTPPRATMTAWSTYEVGGPSTAPTEGPSFPLPVPGLPVPPTVIEDLSTRVGNLEYKHEVVRRKMEEVSDAMVADSIAIGEIHPRVAAVGEQGFAVALAVLITGASQSRQHGKSELIFQVVVDEEIPRDNLTALMILNQQEKFVEIEQIRFAFRVMPVESFSCCLGTFFKMIL
nr:hypothetical protein [Tanacetum cinerariifolium]